VARGRITNVLRMYTYTDVQRTYHVEPAENLTFGPALRVRCSTYNVHVCFMSMQHVVHSRSRKMATT